MNQLHNEKIGMFLFFGVLLLVAFAGAVVFYAKAGLIGIAIYIAIIAILIWIIKILAERDSKKFWENIVYPGGQK